YAIKFADEVFRKCYGNKECDKNESIRIMNELGIDSNKILKCLESEGEKYYNEDIKDAENYGLTGSPSFVINGVYVRVVRSEEGIKEAVCQAFNTKPEICNLVLSTQTQNVPQGSC
ncbi:MAG: DsbA family protein, partial [Nanopusillaceae archaeon]